MESQESLQALKLALRVLTAITENRNPDPADIEALRACEGSCSNGRGVEELACDVIQRSIEHRRKLRWAVQS